MATSIRKAPDDAKLHAQGRNGPFNGASCTMNALHPAWAILLTALAVLCACLMSGRQVAAQQARFTSIDGLRGYLAFFVFLHHAAIWYAYVRTGVWTAPASHLYTLLGHASVSLFFMITSFLFYSKLLESEGGRFDWPKFFIGRLMRLTPLYLFAMLLLLLLVTIVSNGVAQDSALYITKCVVRWLSFTILGAPSINQVNPLPLMAGVTWSLPYEWIFYGALPLLGFTAGVRAAWPFVIISVASLGLAAMQGLSHHFAYVFAAGIVAALLVRNARFKRFAATRSASIAVLVLVMGLLAFPTAFKLVQLALLTAIFSLIAGGTSVFGALSCSASRWLGEFAYSMYLLHGLLLYVAIHYVVGVESVRTMTALMYWLVIAALVPVLLGVCFLTFRWIEKPGIDLTPRLLKLWRRAPKQVSVETPG